MNTRPTALPPSWTSRWSRMAAAVGLQAGEPVVLALSGGADSIFLLHVLAAAPESPLLAAVHVDHRLRGEESRRDARFARSVCARLGVPFVLCHVELDDSAGDLEARARAARYRALAAQARRLGCRTVLTGHHADDCLETVLMRWVRGSGPPSAGALRPQLELFALAAGDAPHGRRVRVVRPLLSMRREEVRRLLLDARLDWCEDSSNRDLRFTRNRTRQRLLPRIAAVCGPGSVENLRSFGAAVEALESHLAAATAHLTWEPPQRASATRSRAQASLGGSLEREKLERLPEALRRRALWRLLQEGTGTGPGSGLLELLLEHLEQGRCARHALPRGWSLLLRARRIHLVPPPALLADSGREPAGEVQLRLPFPEARPGDGPAGGSLRLPVPGNVRLPDGRTLHARYLRCSPAAEVPRSAVEAHVVLSQPLDSLAVRFARAGDRFHPLGGPGSRPLVRFLADEGVPREERSRVPLVLAEGQLVWVAGLRPAEAVRVRPDSALRLCLSLRGYAGEEAAQEPFLPDPGAARPGDSALWRG